MDGILTRGLAIGPLGELDVGLIPLQGIDLQVGLQGTSHSAGCDVRVVHVTIQQEPWPAGRSRRVLHNKKCISKVDKRRLLESSPRLNTYVRPT